MNERIADILDIVLCVIVAAICLNTGVKAVVKNNYEVRQYTSSYSEKNTTIKYTPSEKVYGTYDGALSREECILMTQVQDYEMYGPHTVSYNGTAVDLHPGYEMYESTTRNALWSLLADDADTDAYQVTYDYENRTYRLERRSDTSLMYRRE